MLRFNFPTFIFFISLLVATGCSKERQVVPYDVDSEEIFAPIAPNDEDSPENETFGENKIPGFIFDLEFPSDNAEEVYMCIQNFTVLDINPVITGQLFEFMVDQMEEYGFVNDSFDFNPGEQASLQEEGLSYKEAASSIIEFLKSGFEAQLGEIESYKTPFNIYFQVYPVYLDNQLVTYRQYAYAYTGGAHGITVSLLKSYDLASGKELEFNDIVKPEFQTIVREEVAAHMAYSYPIYDNITTVNQYIDSLNVWLDHFTEANQNITAQDFPVSDVAIVKQGLAFIYQMYELTPGSDGCPLVVVPYRDIQGCLNPNYFKPI